MSEPSSGSAAAPRLRTIRHRAFELLDPSAPDWGSFSIDLILICFVLVNVAAAVLESVPTIAESHARLFALIEVLSVAVFTLEYGLRVWSAPEHALYGRMSPWRARVAMMTRPAMLVDLMAIAPVYVSLLTSFDLRTIIVFRLLRFFKLARYSPGLASLLEAVSSERRALMASGVILMGTVLVTAAAMSYAEHDAQPDKLGTIPDAMYWAFITLATVGYGDVVPVTPLGKAVAAVTAIIGIINLALPVGILASAFADEIRRRDFVVTWNMVAKVPLFADLDAADLAGIMRFLNSRSCEVGQAIVRRGEPAHSMYFITSGTCEVELPAGSVRLGTGDFFGEMALLHGRTRNATVSATTRVKLLVLEAGDLHYLMDQNPRMADRIREVASRREQSSPEPREPGDAPIRGTTRRTGSSESAPT